MATEQLLVVMAGKKRSKKIRHPSAESRRSGRKRHLIAVVVAAVLATVGAAALALTGLGGTKSSADIGDVPYVGSHEGLAIHIHPHLTIVVNGERVQIPAGIGIDSGGMRAIHTHDALGYIHIESPVVRDFTLGQFFDIWGRSFNRTCIFGYCVDAIHRLVMYVDGERSEEFRDHVFRDDEEILLVYGGENDMQDIVERELKGGLGGSAPDFTLETIDGWRFTLQELRGRPVILWFMAAWCPTCVGQAETLKVVEEKFGDRVAIVVIDLWVPQVIGREQGGIGFEGVEDLRQFRDRFGSPSWFWTLDTDRVTIKYGITTVDSTVLISPSGDLVYKQLGPTGLNPLIEAINKVI